MPRDCETLSPVLGYLGKSRYALTSMQLIAGVTVSADRRGGVARDDFHVFRGKLADAIDAIAAAAAAAAA
jgi:hypothetical protein